MAIQLASSRYLIKPEINQSLRVSFSCHLLQWEFIGTSLDVNIYIWPDGTHLALFMCTVQKASNFKC